MRKDLTLLIACALVLTVMAAVQPSAADPGGVPAEIGQYRQFWTTHDLGPEHLAWEGERLGVEGPSFTSELRMSVDFLEAEFGAWGSDTSFAPGEGTADFPGRRAGFQQFHAGPEAIFSWGHEAQIRFLERPMWISVHQEEYGGRITLDMDDGDSSGQSIFISREWLWGRGIHRPNATHEDGTSLMVNETADGEGWIIGVPHFSLVEINPPSLVVKGRQNGLVFNHLGERRWYTDEIRLEVDVGNFLTPYEILVEKGWVDFEMPDVILEDRSWTVQTVHGLAFYSSVLAAAETPTTLVFKVQEWLRDPTTDSLWRPTTATERAVNGWSDGSRLAVTDALGTARAGQNWTLPLPAHPLLEVQWTHVGNVSTSTYQQIGLGEHELHSPTLLLTRYVALGSNLTGYLSFGDARGAYGELQFGDLHYVIQGFESWWGMAPAPPLNVPTNPFNLLLLDPAPASHSDPCRLLIKLILSWLPRDGFEIQVANTGCPLPDDWVSYPFEPFENNEYTVYNLALVGETRWCTRNKNNWYGIMNDVHSDIEAAFNFLTDAHIHTDFQACYIHDTVNQADNCSASGGCNHKHASNYGGGTHAYTFNACNLDSICYMERSWSSAGHWRNHNTVPALSLIQVLKHGTLYNEYQTSICGKGGTPASSALRATSVVRMDWSACNPWYVPTHEIGHNFDLLDGAANGVGTCKWWQPWSTDKWTVMAKPALNPAAQCHANQFSAGNIGVINGCVSNSSCPRPGTG